MTTLLDFTNVLTLPPAPIVAEDHALDLISVDLRSDRAEHRRLLAVSWTPARSAFVASQITHAACEIDALSMFRSGSSFLWATGAWDVWTEVLADLATRFSLTDLEKVVARAVGAEDPDLLGHYAATAVYLDGAVGLDAIDPDVLLPLAGLRTPHYAGYRARRRIAIRRAQAGRTDVGDLLAVNRLAAAARDDAHGVAETVGDAAFLDRDHLGHGPAAALLADGLVGRFAADRRRTAGQAQQVAALALLGDEPLVDLDTALAFAAGVGAHHLVRLFHGDGAAATTDPIQALARVW